MQSMFQTILSMFRVFIKKNKEILHILLVYTLLFCVVFFLCVHIYFQISGKTYLWKYDGLEQSYTFFVYEGKWLRQIFRNVFLNHTFEIPMWDKSIGYGTDIIIYFSGWACNCLADPFMLISGIIRTEYSEIGFAIMMILQMYMAGISFIAFSRYKKHSFYPVIIGSLVYVFSSSMMIEFKQSLFGYIFVLFPLIILGLERIRDGRKPYFYIAFLTMSFAYSYYFTYMAAILIAIYLLVNMLINIFKDKNKEIVAAELKYVLKCVGCSIYSCLMGVTLMIPALYNISTLDRLSIEHYIPLFFDKSFVGRLFGGFISAYDAGTDYIIGYSIIALISCIAIFAVSWRNHIKECILFIIGTIIMFSPLAGSIMNGFNYSTNRWIWGYSFLIAYIVTVMADVLQNIGRNKIILSFSLYVLYGFMVFYIFKLRDMEYVVPYIAGIIILVFIALSDKMNNIWYQRVYLILTIFTVAIPPHYYFGKAGQYFVSQEIGRGMAYSSVERSGGKNALSHVDRDKFFRYDTTVDRTRNSSTLFGLSGYDMYNSAYHNGVYRFQKQMGFYASTFPMNINGVDRRGDLEALFGTEYIIKDSSRNNLRWPVGYTTYGWSYTENENTYDVYLSDVRSSPFSFFDTVYSYSEYLALNPYEKQNMLMTGIVLEDGYSNSEYINDNSSISYSITGYENITVDQDILRVTESGGYMDIHFDEEIGRGELYLLISKISNNDPQTKSFPISAHALCDDMLFDNVNTGGVSPTTKRSHLYGGNDTWILNMGCRDYSNIEEQYKVNGVRLFFWKEGNYSIDDIKLYFESEELIRSHAEGLYHPASEIKIQGNKVSANAKIRNKGYLFISIPYSVGWTISVDGEKVKKYKADEAFMAIEIDEGNHEILMTYETPYLKIGMVLFVIILISGVVAYKIIYRKRPLRNSEVLKVY